MLPYHKHHSRYFSFFDTLLANAALTLESKPLIHH